MSGKRPVVTLLEQAALPLSLERASSPGAHGFVPTGGGGGGRGRGADGFAAGFDPTGGLPRVLEEWPGRPLPLAGFRGLFRSLNLIEAWPKAGGRRRTAVDNPGMGRHRYQAWYGRR